MSGLGARPKHLSPKYFYDRAGSLLFDAICELPEYYVTRTELGILRRYVAKMADRVASGGRSPRVRVVEPGAGSGTKTRLLLRALGRERCVEYVPVDIDGEHLQYSAASLREDLPWLRVSPYAADFTVELPTPDSSSEQDHARTVVYFPGSTIGNFEPGEAGRLLACFRRAAGPDGLVLLGVDLKKDPAVLHSAYNDADGITAAFNKNVLRRMNAELGADFDVERFYHYAFYAAVPGRIEMHLVSAERQEVTIGGKVVTFEEGESVCTEHSYKYDLDAAERLAGAAGLSIVERWLDDQRRFAVLLLSPT
jgi:dimethylhistidine N-methyltransferase